jgi:hypothetical protein
MFGSFFLVLFLAVACATPLEKPHQRRTLRSSLSRSPSVIVGLNHHKRTVSKVRVASAKGKGKTLPLQGNLSYWNEWFLPVLVRHCFFFFFFLIFVHFCL